MRQQGRRPAATPAFFVDPELEQRWQEALSSWPEDNNPVAVAAWNRKHSELLKERLQAAEQVREKQREWETERTKSRRKVATTIVGILLVASGIVYWTNRPSADELQREEILRKDTACTTHYEQTHHLQMVDEQIDLLKDGEGGWVGLHSYSGEAPTVGGLDLSPAELQANKIGKAQVNREGYVYSSALGVGNWGLLERSGGHLVLTLFSLSGFGDLPHVPLQANTISTVIARGEQLSPLCP